MKTGKLIYAGLIAASLVLTLAYFTTPDREATPQSGQQPNNADRLVVTTLRKTPQPTETVQPTPGQADPLAGAVNEKFSDKPEAQKAWARRGQDIVLKNHPTADAANFSNTFFHRGFKYRAVTCGEVQFLNNGKIIDNYQRFIYVGVQSSHLETDVPNFEILWQKLCVQTYE